MQERKFRPSRIDVRSEQRKSCTHCGQEGHVFEQFCERIGYPHGYNGKKVKKGARMAADVSSGLQDIACGETPFDMGVENEIGMGHNGNVD